MPIELLSTAAAPGKPTGDSWGSASVALVGRYQRAFAAAGRLATGSTASARRCRRPNGTDF